MFAFGSQLFFFKSIWTSISESILNSNMSLLTHFMKDTKICTLFFIHICSKEHIALTSKIIAFRYKRGWGLSIARAVDYSNWGTE